MERRLSAILAADVVGYSKLMEQDESGTFERLKAHRKQLFEPEIEKHHGRIFKLMGDGVLAEFGSVVDAVECAVNLQRGLTERNMAVPEDQRIQVRIGVNLGEVIIEGDDRYGEGVNVAARLEQLAEPGSIWVSDKVAREVERKLAFGFEPMGAQQVKNIALPIQAYRVNLEGALAPRLLPARAKRTLSLVAAALLALIIGGAALWFGWDKRSTDMAGEVRPASVDTRPSLVVLPFDNLSDDKEQQYLSDGITEDLTTELARIPGLFVVSRNAAFTYKGKAMRPEQIAKELGVRYILEGSTRRAGADMRLNAQLIDAETGGHIWAERFDGQWGEVFALQDKMVASIAAALKLRLVTGRDVMASGGGTSNPAAYDAYLRGLELYLRGAPEDMVKAMSHYNQAVAIDPDFGAADADLAWLYWDTNDEMAKSLGLSWDEIDARMYWHLEAAAKHPSPSYYQIIAQLLVREHRSDEAIDVLQRAVPLNPSDPWTLEGLSQALIFNGQPQEARVYLDALHRLDPGWNTHYLAGLAAFGEDRFDDAIASLEKIDLESPYPWTKFYGLQVLLAAHGHLGDKSKAAATTKKLVEVLTQGDFGELNLLLVQQRLVFKHESDIERLLEGLRKAGVPELPSDVDVTQMDRLTGAEIKSIIFGHELRGRKIAPEVEDYRRVMSADGSISVTIGSWSNTGKSWVQGDFMCNAYPKDLAVCGATFRNPRGTFEQKNEYLTVYATNRIEFSIVK